MKTSLIIDSHCHINFPRFNPDRDETLRRAGRSGVRDIITSGIDPATNTTALELSETYSFIHPTIGLSPNRVEKLDRDGLAEVIGQITDHTERIVGIGEIGLDYYHCKDPQLRERQERIFKEIVEITTTFEGAVILHARDAEAKALKIVESCDSVVFHCYGGSIETMNEILDHGFYISLATLVCFSQHHIDLAREVPLDRLLVETDSPYLSPRRGRNEPAFIVDAITTIATIKETSFERVAQTTTENARKIFHIQRKTST